MSYLITCPECGGSFQVSAETLTKRVRCKYCRSVFVAVEDAPATGSKTRRGDERVRTGAAPRTEDAPAALPARPTRSVHQPTANRTLPLLAGGAAVGLLVAGLVGGLMWYLLWQGRPADDARAFVVHAAPPATNPPAGAVPPEAAPPAAAAKPAADATPPAAGPPATATPGSAVAAAKPERAPVSPPAEQLAPTGGADTPATTVAPPPPPPAAVPAPPARPEGAFLAGGTPLRYRWRGAPLVYALRVEGERDTFSEILEGHCILNVKRLVSPPVPAEQRLSTGNGTGFVVNPDGYLVTCAHVVRDAVRVDVAVAGRSYLATVLAVDADHDLAILKIDAKGLAALPLGDSDGCQVGQDVWTLGFPLATVLGNDLKVTRGTLSGVTGPAGRKVLLIDAPINPGNSGGPLVAEGGQVIGVNRAKLAGEAVSNVGIASTSAEVKRLLKGRSIAFTPSAGGPRLAGPALVERSSPAVARITVTLERQAAELFDLTWRTALTSREKVKPGIFALPGVPPLPGVSVPGRIQMDASGEVRGGSGSGGRPLPYLLGEAAQFLLEPLPADGRSSWEVSGTCAISQSVSRPFGMPPLPFGPRFGPRLRPPFAEAETREATERAVYTRRSAAGDTVTIHKQYELKLPPSATLPGVSLTGEGTITFAINDGLPQAVEFKGTFTRTDPGAATRIPVSVTYKLVTGAEREKALNPPPPPPPATLDQLLAAVKGTDALARGAALGQLAAMPVDPARRAETARVLHAALAGKTTLDRYNCLRAVAAWGDRESVPVVLPVLEESEAFIRNEAMITLGKLGDERAIEPIAKRLTDTQSRYTAGMVLRQFGARAEKVVLPYLEGSDASTKREVCNVLKTIGTAQCRPALEKAAKDENPLVRTGATMALRALDRRR